MGTRCSCGCRRDDCAPDMTVSRHALSEQTSTPNPSNITIKSCSNRIEDALLNPNEVTEGEGYRSISVDDRELEINNQRIIIEDFGLHKLIYVLL